MNKTNPMNMSPNDYLEIIKKKDAEISRLKSVVECINENIKVVGKQNDTLKKKCDRYEKRLRDLYYPNGPIYPRLYAEAVRRIEQIAEDNVEYGTTYRVSDGITYYVTSDGTIFLEEDQALKYEIAWLKGEE